MEVKVLTETLPALKLVIECDIQMSMDAMGRLSVNLREIEDRLDLKFGVLSKGLRIAREAPMGVSHE